MATISREMNNTNKWIQFNVRIRIFDWIQMIFLVILSFGPTNGFHSVVHRYDLYNDVRPAPVHHMQTSSMPAQQRQNDIVYIAPQYNRTQFFVEQNDIITMDHPPPLTDHPYSLPLHHHRMKNRPCVRCPGEMLAIAKQGLDGFIVEPPAPVACATNLPFSRDLYQIETLFGNQFMFILPHGKHSILGKIRNIETGLVEHTCSLKYNVLVKHCPRYRLKNLQLKMKCSAGTIWGSSCSFECHDPNAQLSHQEPMVCTETSEWIGAEPTCISEMEYDSQRAASSMFPKPIDTGACQIPPRPANGKYSCELSSHGHFLVDGRHLPPSSICRIQCDPLYTIPYHLRALSVIECENGAWNMTMMDFCYRTRPQRHNVSRPRPFRLPHRQPPPPSPTPPPPPTASRIRITTYV